MMNKYTKGLHCIIDDSVEIGSGSEVGNFSILSGDVRVGKNTVIKNYVEIRANGGLITIGDNCVIDSKSLIEGPCIFEDDVVIGPDCEIRPGVTVRSSSYLQGRNRIANNCVIESGVTIKYGSILTSNVYVGEDCFIGPNVIMTGDDTSRVQEEAGNRKSTRIGAGTFIGANSIFMPAVHIGSGCIIGACSFIREDTFDKEVWFGNPAKFKKTRNKKDVDS